MIAQLTLSIPVQPALRCVSCGADLRGRLHRDSPEGPRCAVPCEKKTFQLDLKEIGQ